MSNRGWRVATAPQFLDLTSSVIYCFALLSPVTKLLPDDRKSTDTLAKDVNHEQIHY